MNMGFRVTYLHHSGFLVAAGAYRLIFDFCEPRLDPGTPGGAPVAGALDSGLKVIALASHAHGDHFQPLIVDWAREGRCALVLGNDIKKGLPGVYLDEGQSDTVLGARVRAFGSTDQGVSFLVEADGLTVFHAGDLNFWHWREEADDAYVEDARRSFERVLGTLPAGKIDIAMFPVDGRLGAGHDEGALRFIEHCRPGLLFPMHWWDDDRVAAAFAKKRFPGTRVVALTGRGESYDSES